MNKLQKSAVFLTTGLALLAASSSANAMDKQVERALIKVCKAAITDRPIRLKVAMDDYRLKPRNVALNVVCNDKDIISFASYYGAEKIADRLQRSIGKVRITDVAKVEKVNVNFSVSP